jgi:hypothetical protein
MRLLAKRERLRPQPSVQLDRLALVVCLQLAVALVVGCGRVPPVGTVSSSPSLPVVTASASRLATVASGARTNVTCDSADGTLAPRGASSVAYDPLSRKILLFGGHLGPYDTNSGPPFCDDTWAWNGTDWTQLHPAHHPSARAWAAMAFDTQANRLLLYGGGTFYDMGTTSHDTTWHWNGSDWQSVALDRKGGLALDLLFDSMASAPNLGLMKIGGGNSWVNTPNGYQVPRAAAYNWTGRGWARTSSDGPPEPNSPSLVFDPNLAAFLMFGGVVPGGDPGCGSGQPDMWTTDGKTWTELNPAGPRPCGGMGAMTYDPAHKVVVWVGADGTWSWDGKQWMRLATATQSPPRGMFATLSYDPGHHQILLTGIEAGDGLGHTYVWDGAAWTAR